MKIDVSKIDGFEKMSAEEKLAALTSFEFKDPDYSGYVKKDVFDKTASEAAAYKKQLKEHMSEEEKIKSEQAEETNKLKARLAELETNEALSKNTAKYLGLGYDEKLASETAKALVEGDMDRVFANQAKFLEGKEKAWKAEALKDTPRPPAGDDKTSKDENITFAQSLGKKSAETLNNSSELLQSYLGGEK